MGYDNKEKIILVVDDDVTSLKLAQKILETEYRVAAVNNGEMVFKYLMNNTPDLILLDLNMPEIDGFEVIKRLKNNENYKEIPVIFLTANQDSEIEAKCLESGAIDFVNKPFVPIVLKGRVKRVMELYSYRKQLEDMVQDQAEIIEERTERITHIQNAVIVGMATLIEERDNSTGRHVRSTQHYVEMLCKALKRKGMFRDQLTDDYMYQTIKATPLHDVGKIKIPDAILQKKGKLTEEEFKIIQNHSSYGAEIIDGILGSVEDPDYLQVARDIALYHHERWDGSGYPTGLRGDKIPLCARIMSIADVFDALYEERVYKKAIRPVRVTLSIIEDGRGTQFDPDITDVFLELDDEIRDYVGEERE